MLIYKKGDQAQPKNWRPISLQPTIYKVYPAVLARRLACWSLENRKISSAQRGFLPFEGCAEHSFLLRSALEDSKCCNKDITIVWLDLRNAFGSVPHDIMWDMMARLNIISHVTDICKDIYEASSQSIKTINGNTPLIPLIRGIKQGCPLSPLLFNIALEGVLPGLMAFEGYQFQEGAKLTCLAHADDICLISGSKSEMQEMVHTAQEFFEWAGLELNAEKCGALTMVNYARRKYVEPFSPSIDDHHSIPALKWEDTYKYLGHQVGRDRGQSPEDQVERALVDVEKITSSLLAE